MKVLDDGTVLLPLPPSMQRPISGGCQCPFCKTHPETNPMWDALAGHPNSRVTWTVHAPELGYETGGKLRVWDGSVSHARLLNAEKKNA